jgi:GTPase SAR1 family protein
MRMSFHKADVVIVCFLVGSLPDYDLVRDKWDGELRDLCPGLPRIIVGIEPDEAYSTSDKDIVRGNALAKEIYASRYIQCNLESGAGVDDVFEGVSSVISNTERF